VRVKATTCTVCGDELPQRRTRFCSRICADFLSGVKQKRKTLRLSSLLTPRKCIGCGQMFQPKTDRHRSCNKVCWDIVVAERMKKKRVKNRGQHTDKPVSVLRGTRGSGNKHRRNGIYKPIEINVSKTLTNATTFTVADTKERVELQSKVEQYLANGGKIMKYGAQPAVKVEDSVTTWEISSEEEEIALERYRAINAYNGN